MIVARLLVLAAALALVLGACGAQGPTAAPSGTAEPIEATPEGPDVLAPGLLPALFGEWSARPFPVPPALVAKLDAACRADLAPFVGGVQLVVVDARGKGVAQAYFAGVNGNLASCYDLQILPTGEIEPGGAGSTTSASDFLTPMALTELRITDSSSSGDPATASYVAGRAGAGIAAVQLAAPNRVIAQATLRGGWFAAWVPGPLRQGWFLRALNAAGVEVATLPGT